MKRVFFAAFFVVFISAASDGASFCPGGVDIPFCICQISESGFARVICRLNNETIPLDVFRKLGAIAKPIDSLTVICKQHIKFLETIPKFECRSLRLLECGIQRVSEQAFDALADSLEELILAKNQISVFPFVQQLHNLKVLNLDENELKDIPEHSFDGLLSIRQLRMKNNQIYLLLPNALNETKTTLELLDLSGNHLVAVPAQNIRNALALTHLSLANNRIGEMTQMTNLPRLVELRLNGNRLTRISSNAFVNVTNLRTLALNNNLLRKFDSSMLRALKKLIQVNLSDNQLVKAPTFKDMPELMEVNLKGNNIEKIDTLTFSSTPKLRVISLQDNQISAISRNSFDALDGLHALLLANNSLKSLEKSMFDGMRNLRFLILSHNAISTINANAFAGVPNLHVVELSNNRIERLRAGTFAKLNKLAILDLSNNTNLTIFEKGCFQSRVGTIFLNGIELNCDDDLDWFIGYLVKNNVRTFVPDQPEIRCATPPKYAGHRLRDLMMTKANETLATSMQNLGFGQGLSGQTQQQANFLQRFLPAIPKTGGGSLPVLNSITQAMPSLREIPGLSSLTQRYGQPPSDKNLDSAIEQFTEPLVNFATGGHSDIGQLLKTIPNLVVNVPGFDDVDVSKLPPQLIQHVLSGAEVPGIPRETLDKIVKQYMERMYYAAARAQNINPVDVEAPPENVDIRKYLLPLDRFPQELISKVMEGASLPYLNDLQTQIVKDYYATQMPTGSVNGLNISALISPKMLQMFKLLPRGYNLSEIPPDVIRALQAGEIPDLTRLPPTLLQHFKDNLEKVMDAMNVGNEPSMSIDELLKKLPNFDPVVDAPTFSPYDINEVDSDLVVSKHDDNTQLASAHLLATLGLGALGALSAGVLALFCYRLSAKRRRGVRASQSLRSIRLVNNSPKTAAVRPESSFLSDKNANL